MQVAQTNVHRLDEIQCILWYVVTVDSMSISIGQIVQSLSARNSAQLKIQPHYLLFWIPLTSQSYRCDKFEQ